MTTDVASTTTYFVGTHYELTNGIVTKYYYAGNQRIATLAPHCVWCSAGVRKNSTLNYIIGDHLGSTSLVTDASGNVINQTQYKAWGEERYSSGTKQTNYGYTGQYSYAADFGLQFYNARWYDSSLGRFTQADTIVPGGVQGYDRYAYVNNNPVKYTDPSGHCIESSGNVNMGSYPYGTSGLCAGGTTTQKLEQFGVSTVGSNHEQQENALNAATNFGQYYYEQYGSQYGFASPQDAFKKLTGGNITIILDNSRGDCITGSPTITCDAGSMTMKAFVHEFIHLMDKLYQSRGSQVTEGCSGACLASSNLPSDYYTKREFTIDAYKCTGLKCVSHPDNSAQGPDQDYYYSYESFANAGENLILGTLGIDLEHNGFKDTGTGPEVQDWMNDNMSKFLDGIVGVQQ